MKKFDLKCTSATGQEVTVTLYIGKPDSSHNPIQFQIAFASHRGVTIPQDIIEALDKIKVLAEKHAISFEDLCYFAMTTVNNIEREKEFEETHDLAKLEEVLNNI